MRFQVPQFVDIEDKIIGPFTLKQFLIYVAAVMVLVPVYLASDLSLFITIAVPILGLAALFAHFRLHGKSLFAVVGHALSFFLRGQLFVWRRVPRAPLLPIIGEEYDQFSPVEVSSLSARAQAIETVGSVVHEDIEDVIDPEAGQQAPPVVPTSS